jgi:hypothetical protein
MLTRRRVFASLATVSVAAAAGCASSGVPSSSWFDQSRASPSGTNESAEGSAVALSGAPAEQGPRVSIYADVSAIGGARHVRATFHLDDDAYVVVGHIDADGVLRIEFPTSPQDNGFARGRASYSTAEFFAGFGDEYRARFTTDYNLMSTAARNDSYDGGLGYVFVIASWQPMRFDQFSSNGTWDSYEVSNADYRRDPRPAVYELASLLAGTNPDAYTVKFARVFNTQSTYGDAFSSNAYGARLCSGLQYGFNFGFQSDPFGLSMFNPLQTYGYGQSFYYRGSLYEYSAGDDCYFRNPMSFFRYAYSPFGYGGYNYPYGYGYGYGQNPGGQTPPPTGGGRFVGINQIRRSPVSPQTTPMQVAPGGATDVGATNTTHMTLAPETTSPQYRTRGLVAHEDPAGGEIIAPRSVGNDRRARDAGSNNGSTMPMVFRGSDNGSRSQSRDDGNVRRAPTARTETPSTYTPRVVESPRTEAPRAAPQPRVEAPRSEPVRMAPSPPPARVESPRSEPARSEPAARSAPPASSSSSGKPPGKN